MLLKKQNHTVIVHLFMCLTVHVDQHLHVLKISIICVCIIKSENVDRNFLLGFKNAALCYSVIIYKSLGDFNF